MMIDDDDAYDDSKDDDDLQQLTADTSRHYSASPKRLFSLLFYLLGSRPASLFALLFSPSSGAVGVAKRTWIT